MTGPEHYLEAERLIAEANEAAHWALLLSVASIHATLALTAATANAGGDELAEAWYAVTT